MTRLPRVTGKDVLRALKRLDFQVDHIEGSHHYLRRRGGGRLVTVPVHAGETLTPKTLKTILDQAELSVDELREIFRAKKGRTRAEQEQ
ncbi:type II toxin-antitoxin system HicA family toxin [Gelria sp. Kuro-4]|uniref:type II toxin-antitoxin system HicA family toxin n=1 Tax=Gelria sp. Kuro-4 TaxID=2796927 RepID=UPI001BF0EF55|nr:type II toxin-antitoxin system HicA family toxin [Gelria sp. Kuro-4]BCV23834.1 hypothetical protein kuro4_06070 [Gelria sp. Kuro-4]